MARTRARTAATILTALALLVAACAAPPLGAGAKPQQRHIRGIDVSRFQGHVAWRQVGKTQNRFAFVQASRGSGHDCLVIPDECGPDPRFEHNYKGAHAEGIRVGAYHRAFAAGRTVAGAKADARAEADVFIATVGRLRNSDLLPALDVETPFKNLDEEELQVWINVWCRRVQLKLGYKPIIYTNQSSWLATGDTTRFARDGHPLWVANFDVKRPAVPASNWGHKGWSIWQFSSTGHVRGIDGAVDRNRLARGFGRISVAGR
jgi:lysozyme